MIVSLILIFPALGNSNLSYNLHVTSNTDNTNTILELCTFVFYCLLLISVTHLTVFRCRYCWLSNVWPKYTVDNNRQLISITNLTHKFFYSITICRLHYNPRHVSSINMPIFRRTNCIITDESRLCRVCSHPAYCTTVYREWRYQMLW